MYMLIHSYTFLCLHKIMYTIFFHIATSSRGRRKLSEKKKFYASVKKIKILANYFAYVLLDMLLLLKVNPFLFGLVIFTQQGMNGLKNCISTTTYSEIRLNDTSQPYLNWKNIFTSESHTQEHWKGTKKINVCTPL